MRARAAAPLLTPAGEYFMLESERKLKLAEKKKEKSAENAFKRAQERSKVYVAPKVCPPPLRLQSAPLAQETSSKAARADENVDVEQFKAKMASQVRQTHAPARRPLLSAGPQAHGVQGGRRRRLPAQAEEEEARAQRVSASACGRTKIYRRFARLPKLLHPRERLPRERTRERFPLVHFLQSR